MPSKKNRPKHHSLRYHQTIERRIYLIRSEKVVLNADLADLYQAEFED